MSGMENIRLLMESGGMPLVLGFLAAILLFTARLVVLLEALMYEDDDIFEEEDHE